MRGTEYCLSAFRRARRITPARAGNRCQPGLGHRPRQDHPRACGEQLPNLSTQYGNNGSPPRVRGTERMGLRQGFRERITPARAGNRCGSRKCQRNYEDHPRACGEQDHHHGIFWHHNGSPPRVRGTVFPLLSSTKSKRITPARAGNSKRPPVVIQGKQDHPRACGEQCCGRC